MTLPNRPPVSDSIPNGAFSYPETPATFDRLFGTLVPNIQLDPNPSDIVPDCPSGEWVRPADWLPMPTVNDTQQAFAGLFAIFDTPENFLALLFEGDYIVDWGDGTIENVPSGEKAQHSYNWNDIPSSTLTTRGYRQVVVTVTPQSGQDLTQLNLAQVHSNMSPNAYYPSIPWLDLLISMPNATTGTSIIIDGDAYSGVYPYTATVERVQIINAGNCSSFYQLLYYEYNLQVFVLGPNEVTNFSNTLGYCSNVNTIKLQNVTSLDYLLDLLDSLPGIYGDGYSGISLYLENISGVYSLDYFFENREEIQKVVINGMPDVSSMDNAFDSCDNLETVIIGNMPSLESMYETFEYCYGLKTVTIGDCPILETTSLAFYECEALRSVQFGQTPLLNDTSNMFDYCLSLSEVPALDMTNVFDAGSMFDACYSILTVPNFNLSSVEYVGSMFYFCSSLVSVPAFNFESCTNFGTIFQYCNNLQSAPITGVSSDISFVDCLLGRDAIVEIFTNLLPASATIDVSGNYGVPSLSPADIAIATDKGWSVTT